MKTKRLVKSVLLVLVLLVMFVVPVFAQVELPPGSVSDLPGSSDLPEGSGSIFGALAVIIALAFLVETLVEALFGRIAVQIPTLAVYKWLFTVGL